MAGSWDEKMQAMVGARLRRARLQQNHSVRDLALLAGMSKTSVVQAESGRTSRRSTYVKIAAVLGLHMDLLEQPGSEVEKPFAVHRRTDDRWFDMVDFGDGPLGRDAQNDPSKRTVLSSETGLVPLNILVSRLEQGRIKPTILELTGPSPTRWHAGEEMVYVLAGSALVTVGADVVTIEEGESITFWSSEPHSYAPAKGSPLPVRLLSVRVDG